MCGRVTGAEKRSQLIYLWPYLGWIRDPIETERQANKSFS